MPIFILTLSQSGSIDRLHTLITFLVIHLLVYPASNGYNSFVDRDEGPIGGLEKPPVPTRQLFYLTLIMDIISTGLSFLFVTPIFSMAVFIYIMASRAYSSRLVRLKKYPIIGFLTVVVFQGAFTFFMCYVGINFSEFEFSRQHIWILFACSFQIAGAYPLTQIYQHKEDLADGVTTLSYKLGYTGTFIFTALMFALCNIFYYLYFKEIGKLNQFFILQLFFLPIVSYFGYWFVKVLRNKNEANFTNTMRMNTIASICMNVCFTVLCFIAFTT